MSVVVNIRNDIKNGAVIIECSDGSVYRILAKDYENLPFSCRAGGEIELSAENPQVDNPYYDGDKEGYLSFLTHKYNIYNSALSKVSVSDMTKKQLFVKLFRSFRDSFDDADLLKTLCGLVCGEFELSGYINDYEYAYKKAVYLKYSKLCGPWKIRQYLYEKGVDKNTVDDVMDCDELSDYSVSAATLLAAKYMPEDLSDRETLSKAWGYLRRAGYDSDQIQAALESVREGM